MSASARSATAAPSSVTADHLESAPWRAVYATTGPGGTDETSDNIAMVDITRPADLAVAMSEGDRPRDRSPVLMLGTPRVEHEMRVAASVLVGHLPDVPVAIVLSDHAPLAGVLALRAAQEAAVDAGQAVVILQDVLAASWSAVVTDTVTSMDHPAPSLLQHVRSWLPGSRFIVRLGDRPAIVPASRPLLALDGATTRDRVLHMSPPRDTDTGTDAEDIAAAIASWTTSKAVVDVTLPEAVSAVPGLETGVQLALTPENEEERHVPTGPPCSVCGLTVAGSVCNFCHARRSGAPLRGGVLPRVAA